MSDHESGAASLAEMMSSFSRLMHLEEQMEAVVAASRIPPSEVRVFLRAEGTDAVRSTPAYQYLVHLFEVMEVGKLGLLYADGFEYIFTVRDSTVMGLFGDVENEKVCLPIQEFLSRFFGECMGLECDAAETQCARCGHDMCEFLVSMKPMSVYPYVLSGDDMDILRFAGENPVNINSLARTLSLEPGYVISRLEALQSYGFLAADNSPEPALAPALRYIEENRVDNGDFPPPWEDFSKIANAIAGVSSFAAALKEVADSETLPWEEDDGEGVVELKEKAEKSGSFAEFIASIKDEEDE